MGELSLLGNIFALQGLTRQVRVLADAGDRARVALEESRIAELENQAAAQVVAPIRPPLPPAQRIAAPSGAFEFGVPAGFGPLPAPMLERWTAAAGPTLATVVDSGAPDLPMLISVSPPERVEADVARGFWRLTLDLAPDVRNAVEKLGQTVTEGPNACRIGEARAIEFAMTGYEAGGQVRSHVAIALVRDEGFEITMNVRPAEEQRCLPVWWTVLGTWLWLR